MGDTGGTRLAAQDLLPALRDAHDHAGPWWSVATPLEVLVGTVLVQNTAWRNVETSLGNLREAGVHDAAGLLDLGEDRLRELVRPSGFQNAKSQTVRGLLQWWEARVAHPLDRPLPGGGPDPSAHTGRGDPVLAHAALLPHVPTEDLRAELLSLRGIGPESADVVLLSLLGRGVAVADTYARRVLGRLGAKTPRGYRPLARLLQGRLDLDLDGWQELHALIDEVGKSWASDADAWAASPLGGYTLLI